MTTTIKYLLLKIISVVLILSLLLFSNTGLLVSAFANEQASEGEIPEGMVEVGLFVHLGDYEDYNSVEEYGKAPESEKNYFPVYNKSTNVTALIQEPEVPEDKTFYYEGKSFQTWNNPSFVTQYASNVQEAYGTFGDFKAAINKNGGTIPQEILDRADDSSPILWYVIKDQSDGWHLDGILLDPTVTITANSSETVYTGEEQVVSGYTWEGLPEGYTVTGITAESKTTDVTDDINTVDVEGINVEFKGTEGKTQEETQDELEKSVRVLDKDGKDVTGKFEFEFVEGKQAITPAILTVTADDKEVNVGDDVPELTSTITGFVGKDIDSRPDITGEAELSTLYTTSSGEGNYPIVATVDEMSADNYIFVAVDGNLVAEAEVIPPLPIPTPPTPVVVIEEPGVPLAAGLTDTVTVDDQEVPLAAGGASWSLLDLILTIATGLMSGMLLITYFARKREDEDEYAEYGEVKRKGMLRLMSIIPMVGAIILFILTQDMTLPMIIVDEWTIYFAAIAIVQGVVTYFSKKKVEEYEDYDAMA